MKYSVHACQILTTTLTLSNFESSGFSTTKGGLMRSILSPKPVGFKFFRDSMRFVGLMTILGRIHPNIALCCMKFLVDLC